jgi:hypothetical protein
VKLCLILLIALLGTHTVSCQKIVKKALLLPQTSTIQIDAALFSQVVLETIPGNELYVEASMEGEYQRDIGIEITEEGNTLSLEGAFQPFFEMPNDKLSAHKIVSVTLLARIPEDMMVLLYGTSTHVKSKGKYRELDIVLNDGHCNLEEPGGKVGVTTQSGKIFLLARNGELSAETKYGSVKSEKLPDGRNHYRLQSISGDIIIEWNQKPK